jgi:hypothetical protein
MDLSQLNIASEIFYFTGIYRAPDPLNSGYSNGSAAAILSCLKGLD